MPLRLYDYAASANCYKVRLLLAQLELEYERVPIDIFAGDTMSPDYAAKNPSLTTPVLELAPGEYLPESNAILLHLAERAGGDMLPTGDAERAQVYRWLFFEQASVVSIIGALRFRVLTGRMAPESEEAQRLKAIGSALVAMVDGHLAAHEFFVAGRYTVADVGLYGYLHVAHEAGVDMAPHRNLAAWLERVRAQPNHVADLAPYPENAHAGRSKSIYDMFDI